MGKVGTINVSTLGREELKTTVLVFDSDKLSLFSEILYMALSFGRRNSSNDLTEKSFIKRKQLVKGEKACTTTIGRLIVKDIVFSCLTLNVKLTVLY